MDIPAVKEIIHEKFLCFPYIKRHFSKNQEMSF